MVEGSENPKPDYRIPNNRRRIDESICEGSSRVLDLGVAILEI
jgi:hypothetical protein